MEAEDKSLVESLNMFTGDPFQKIQAIVVAMIIKLTYGSKIDEEHGEELTKINVTGVELVAWCFSQVWIFVSFLLGYPA